MVYQALYRKWRPKRFEDVCGQEHITSILQYEIRMNTFSHAYLFCGSRGTGKTTCAKILAKAVNCEHPENGSPCGECAACRAIDNGSATDVLEIDAASNNGVDNVRDIRDEVVYSPSALKYRVYIVDEVHMLSVSAFNALLKTLEEPPAHVIFILATTELHKLPETIISRCQRFDFRRIAVSVLQERLLTIAGAENITLEPEAARMLAKLAQGGMRDAISLLELCAGSRKPITPALVCATVGNSGREDMMRVATAIAGRQYDSLLHEVAEVVASARDISVFWQDLISFYRDMLVMKTARKATDYLDLTDSEEDQLKKLTACFTKEQLIYHSKMLTDALVTMQKSGAPKRTVAEIALLRMCDESLSASPEALLSRVSRLEAMLAGGGVTVHTAATSPEENISDCQSPAEQPVKPTKPAGEKSGVDKAVNPHKETDARVLKVLRAWVDVIERVKEFDLPASSFLRQVKAYRAENGTIVLRADSEFTLNMITTDAVKGHLCRALSLVLGQEIKLSDIVMETVKPDDEDKDVILDELME